MNEWDSRLVSALSSSILKLAQASDIHEDTDLLAVEMLCKHRLITKNAAAILLETKLSDDEIFARKWELDNLLRRQEETAATLNRILALP
ncbi:hypothetical protein NST84_18060 [Paenibacillus sp. FSL R7-0345]|uniref:hypothetical protein n=1 Tax=Paenibacillus sp. FSL R7-0345 TaxID=2954535 RepID=UPI00315A7AFA